MALEPTTTIIIASCAICGAPRKLSTDDTWFFIGGQKACRHVCSRECLVKFVQALPADKPPIAKVKYDGYHIVTPQRRD